MLLPVVVLAACDPSGPRSEGWAPATQTGGPTVVWDAEAQPLPEVPLPNDGDPSDPSSPRDGV